MKAWHVEDLDNYEGYATIVFAETRSQAKLIAMGTDACEDAEYIRIRAVRDKRFDSAYRGISEMDWYDENDRRIMVQNGWSCVDSYIEWCKKCSANEWCSKWEEYQSEMESEYV